MPNSRPSRPESLIGCTVADRYLIESAIGDGGMATVYRANQIHLRRPVALKVLKSRYCDQPDSVERFVREARAASAIRSPYVVDILDVGEITGTTVFIAMELLEGPTLERLLLQEGKMRWSRACRLALQIVSGLRAVHEHGIVHRDIKPSNCMVVRDDRGQEHVKILDFGIAKLSLSASEHELTQTGAIFGTAKYMSPEQSRGQKVDARTDIYAFGVILYEMLAGRVPFEGDNFAQVATRHVKEAPPPLHDLGLPPGVEALVMRCLAKTPQERFTSMRELESSLMALTGGHQPPKASPRSTLTEGTVVLKDGGLPADYARQSRPAPGQRPATDASRAHAQRQTGRHDQAGRHAQRQTGRHDQAGRHAQHQTGRHDQAGRHAQHQTGRHDQAGRQRAASLPGGAVPQRTLLIGNNTAAPAQSDAKLPPRNSGKSGGKPMPAPKSAKSPKSPKAAPPKTMVMAIAAAAVVFVGGFSWWYVQGGTPSHADLIAQAQQISQASLVPAGSGQDADEAIAAAAQQAAAIQEAALAQQAAALEQAGSPEQAKAIKEAFAAQQAVAAQMAKAAQQQVDQAQGALTDKQAELIKQAQAQQAQVIAQAQAAQKAALEQAQKAAQQHAQAMEQEQAQAQAQAEQAQAEQAQAEQAQAEQAQAEAQPHAQIEQPAEPKAPPAAEPKPQRAQPAQEPRAAAAPVGREDAFEPSPENNQQPAQEPERAPEPKEQEPPQAPANDAADESKRAEDKPSDSDRSSKSRRSRRHDRSRSPGVQRLTALTPKDIEQSLRVARRLIRSKCGGPGLRLSIRMELEILPSGKLISGRALPPFDRSEVGACAERYVRLARFPQRDRQDSTFVVESFKLGRHRR